MNTLPEWTDLRFFLELARAGTLSGAARRLQVDHTTVARRIDRLEQQLGTALFDRSREGYELTEMGHGLLPHAEDMESSAQAAHDQLTGMESGVRGLVRLSVPEVLGIKILTPVLAAFLTQHQELSIDLLVGARFANLAIREADIGITLDAPTTGRYMVTRLATTQLYLYGSPDYLASHAPIRTKADLEQHDFVDYVQDRLASTEMSFMRDIGCIPRRRFCCTSMLAQAQAVAAGMGLMLAPPYADLDASGLVRVLEAGFKAERTYYLAAPLDLYRLPRVRAIWDLLRNHADANQDLFAHFPAGAAVQPLKRA
jgi:DNA-binding transcriptional LysR family regulator